MLADEAELDGVPEDAADALQNGFVLDAGAELAVVARKSAKTGWACMGTWPKTS
jgi:hypothetical protein